MEASQSGLQSIIDNATDTVPTGLNVGLDTAKKPEPRMKQVDMELENYKRQDNYLAIRKAKGGLPNIVAPEAFIRGMRDLGYKDPAWAMAELIDNSVQANAHRIEVRFGFEAANASRAKNPSHIAIIDDGVGMKASMLTYAVEWGGTDREDDRTGFGRYGYGLPNSCISIACRYTVFSKIVGGEWNAITIDMNEIFKVANDVDAVASLLAPKRSKLPKWLTDTPTNGVDVSTLESGTVIVLEDLDRLRKMDGWIMVKPIADRLKKRFGLIYRHWLSEVKIVVDGDQVEAVDPLFLLEYGRHFDETKVRAKKIAERVIEVSTPEGKKGNVRIRAALLPPTFSWANPDDPVSGRSLNQRWKQVLSSKEQLNGLLICREGRQIDVVQPEWTKFQNYDVYLKVEINFDAVLDELFNITTSKQQIRIDGTMWDKLKSPVPGGGGLPDLVNDMRNEFQTLNDALKARVENAKHDKAAALPAALAMEEAERFRTKAPRLSDQARQVAKKNLEEAITETAKVAGIPVAEARKKLTEAVQKRSWDIDYQALDEGPFFIPKRLGDQKRIILNTAHAFYTRLYGPAKPDVKAALDVLLFVLADGEINADDERARFYRNERGHWSHMLQHALSALVHQAEIEDTISMQVERAEMSAETR